MNAITKWVLRLGGAAMLGATAGIHADLYQSGYKHIPRIGKLFLLLVIGASILCLATLAAPGRLVVPVAIVGALTEAVTVASLLILRHHTIPGLDGYRTSSSEPHYHASIYVEVIGVVLLAALAVVAMRRSPDQS